MIKGINEAEENIIKSVLKPYMENTDFYYYGSRVKGTQEKTSDLDILIKGNSEFSQSDLETIKFLFDKSDLPYIVNFTDFHKIDISFYNLIQKDLVKIM